MQGVCSLATGISAAAGVLVLITYSIPGMAIDLVMHIPMKTLYLVEPICGVLIVLARILKYAQMLAERKGAKE